MKKYNCGDKLLVSYELKNSTECLSDAARTRSEYINIQVCNLLKLYQLPYCSYTLQRYFVNANNVPSHKYLQFYWWS